MQELVGHGPATSKRGGLELEQNSTTSGQSRQLIQGSVKSSDPSYTDADTSPFSLTTAGALRTDVAVQRVTLANDSTGQVAMVLNEI